MNNGRKKTLGEPVKRSQQERARILKDLGFETWTTEELKRDFTVVCFHFQDRLVAVTRKTDNVKGALQFDHHYPRVYYNWEENPTERRNP